MVLPWKSCNTLLILLMDIWKLWERMDGPAVCQIGMLGNYEERVLLSVSGLNNS